MRLDVVLFELRLFKSRSQAQAAIESGAVLLRGERAKPSHAVHAGDELTLAVGAAPRTIEIVELPTRSLTKDAAKALIRERPPRSG